MSRLRLEPQLGPGQRQRKRRTVRDPWGCQDEVLPVWDARVEAGSQRQGHVREHRTK